VGIALGEVGQDASDFAHRLYPKGSSLSPRANQ
jgi:hypothetical protein